MAAFLPELFATRYRYSGAALAYALGGVLGGALPPIIATKLQGAFPHASWTIGVYLALVAVISLVCTAVLPETRHRMLTDQPAELADGA